MGCYLVRYNSRVINYDHRGFIRLATGVNLLVDIRSTEWRIDRKKNDD